MTSCVNELLDCVSKLLGANERAANGVAGIPCVLEAQPPRRKSPATAAAYVEGFIWFCSLCTLGRNLASSLRRAACGYSDGGVAIGRKPQA